ncbi:MAG: RDD family protein [Solirubrobacteraceae bacterium]|nr:RDD family protein [Solirubrobacteraceae bacterium]
MTQPPPNQPFGNPGSQPLGIPGATPQGQPLGQPQGPSLQKPSFAAPQPSTYGQPAGGAALVLAGWGARFGAIIIDALVKFVISFVIATVLFVLFADDPFSTVVYDEPDGISNLGGIFVAAFFIHYIVLSLAYGPIFMTMWNGATPGKRAVGIRVVTEAGVAPSFGVSVLRESVAKTIVMTWIGGWMFFPWLLNYLWPLWEDQSRAGHDFMARTRVVNA